MNLQRDPVRAAEDLARRALARKRAEGATTPNQASPNSPGGNAVLRLVEHPGRAGLPPAMPGEALTTPLPNWSDTVRCVPNVFLRSALFAVLKKGPHRRVERQLIAAVQGTEVLYSGEQLDQGDLDVWTMLLHLLREQTLGSPTRLTAYQMLRGLGRTDTGGNRDVLHTRLTRLNTIRLTLRVGRYRYQGSLIDGVNRDAASREYVIRLNPDLHALFAKDQYTELDAAIRRALDGKPLAQWLHGFYSSHAAPLPIAVTTLHRLCGSQNRRLNHFREELKKALMSVTQACNANGCEFRAEILDDLVHVQRTPSRSQRKHLARKTGVPR